MEQEGMLQCGIPLLYLLYRTAGFNWAGQTPNSALCGHNRLNEYWGRDVEFVPEIP